MNFLKKVQNLPLTQRKIIFWAIIIIFGLGFLTLWIIMTRERLQNIKIGEFIEKMKPPSWEIPGLGNQELEKIEGILKEIEGIKNDPEKLEKLKQELEKNPEKLEELLNNPEKLKELIKGIEEQNSNP